MQLQTLANSLNLVLQGNPDLNIDSLAPVSRATADQLTFVVSPKYVDALRSTSAGAVILPEALVSEAPCSVLLSTNPYLSYSQATQLLYPDAAWQAGISASATVAPNAAISPSAYIGPQVVVESDAVVSAGAYIGPGCIVGAGAVIGEGSYLHANVTVYHECQLGRNCRLQAGVVIGADGFGYAPSESGWSRIKQVGRVIIGDRVEIGANTTIDRGALDDTIICDGVILDNLIQVAHNVRIGKNTAIAACVGIAGSTTIGENCTIGGMSAIVGHLNIPDNVHLTATSFVTRSIEKRGSYSSGMPLQPTKQWRRTYARLSRLEDLVKSIKKLTSSKNPS